MLAAMGTWLQGEVGAYTCGSETSVLGDATATLEGAKWRFRYAKDPEL